MSKVETFGKNCMFPGYCRSNKKVMLCAIHEQNIKYCRELKLCDRNIYLKESMLIKKALH